MRSFAFIVLAACGATEPCPSYEADVAPVIARSCLACHSIEVRGANRQSAPRDANYDTREDVSAQSAKIVQRLADMPPRTSSQPRLSPSEMKVIERWQSCGNP